MREHRFDIDYRRSIYRFQRPHFQSISGDFQNRNPVQAQWIGSGGRTGGKDPGQRPVPVPARVHLQ